MNKKTKFLAISDIHGDTSLVKRLAEKAEKENIDIVILAGDLTWMEKSINNLVGPFIKNKNRKVLILHGNHESIATIDFLSEMYPDTKNMHAYSIKHSNIGIFGVGGANFGKEPMTEKDFKNALEQAHNYIKEINKKIL